MLELRNVSFSVEDEKGFLIKYLQAVGSRFLQKRQAELEDLLLKSVRKMEKRVMKCSKT